MRSIDTQKRGYAMSEKKKKKKKKKKGTRTCLGGLESVRGGPPFGEFPGVHGGW
jgi:hypothetical protein